MARRDYAAKGSPRKEASMRTMLALLAVLPGFGPAPALAEGWERLDGPGITAALAARVPGYPDGTR